MDIEARGERATGSLDDYVSGPTAGPRATARALTKVDGASAVVLVEGLSDQIALETLAARQGRDLRARHVVILPVGGAHAVQRYLTRFSPARAGAGAAAGAGAGAGAGIRLAGLCDAGEEEIFRRGLAGAGLGSPATRAEMARLGFHVCVADLEDELIRALGVTNVEALLDANGDLGAFRTLQSQVAWRGRAPDAQLRRFFGSGSRRKLRYARLLVEAVALDRVPHPLDAVLAGL
ncbi:TOPRIM nucleotidyl transferase/hydrolase domain-containing protein [Phytohabitans suffuscus]|uniref:TOPRIM nucleotidyl transferase/hydrolase domain-containing protein n=1 Tax=Phytohabitans suffuscus TaxID=624315 RepID=UPI001E4DF98B|nr:TOPRIM nucleotidyl transferase/hydrolase domain-containing protein [Phytohabitans suffuscus]